MNYENIVKLQLRGLSFDDAKFADLRGIKAYDDAAVEDFENELAARAERLADLEERGFYNGTDDPFLDEEIEAGNRFQDKYDMYRNEY